MNPATVTDEKARAWRAAGVNRVSLGAQSFDAAMLELLGRQHGPRDVAETCGLLRAHGFTNLNIDLIFALPGQPLAPLGGDAGGRPCVPAGPCLGLRADLRGGHALLREARAVAAGGRGRDRDVRAHARRAGRRAGLPAYEISNFARPGFESRHNLAYWRGADYLGLGPSACSTIGGIRWRNVPNTPAYIDRVNRGESVRGERETLDDATRAKERIMFGLRIARGRAARRVCGCRC